MPAGRPIPFMWILASAFLLSWAPRTTAQLIVGQENENEFVYHVDVNTAFATALFRPVDNGITVAGVEGLAVDDANRTIYWSTGSGVTDSAIYSAHYDDKAFDFSGKLRVKKVCDIRYNATLQRITGLAYDTANAKMYATDPFQGTTTGPEGIYEIDLNTGVSTQVVDLGPVSNDWELRGLDYNPADGLLYATNVDSTPHGIGLFSIDLGGSGIPQPVASLAETNLRGLAVGNDRAYIVADDPGVIHVYNLLTSLFESDISPNPWSGSTIDAGGGWGPSALTTPPGANLGVAIQADVDENTQVGVGDLIHYTVQVANFGPDPATNVTYEITLAGTATGTIVDVASTSGMAVQSPTGTVTATFANVAVGPADTVTFDVTTTGVGELIETVSFPPGGEPDGYLGNNTESISHAVVDFPPVELIFTSIASSPKSDVPGLPGAKFDLPIDQFNEKFRTPARSPDGRYIALWADTNLSSTTDEVFMLGDNGVFSVAAQEGVTTTTDGDSLGTMILNPWISLNDTGQFAIANNTNAASNDETIIRWTGVNFVAVAREGDVVPAFAGQGYTYPGFSLDSPNISASGRTSFRIDGLVGAPTGQNEVLVGNNGATVLAQEGLDVPTGQAGGGSATYALFFDHRFWTDALGNEWLTHARLNNGNVLSDEVLVVNGQVVLQEGQIIPGSGFTTGIDTNTMSIASNFNSIVFPKMLSNADWFCRGTNIDEDEDWLVKGNGAAFSVLARRGDEIYPGAGEHWDDAGAGESWNRTFIAVAANNQGDFIIVGRTDNLDTHRNTVAVLNKTKAILREGDPIDLDDNGMFDDNMFIRFFQEAGAVLTDGGDFYCNVDLTDNSGTGLSGDFVGKAFVRVPLPGCPTLAGDVDGNMILNGLDVQSFVECFLTPGAPAGQCNCADHDSDDDVDDDDLDAQVQLLLTQ